MAVAVIIAAAPASAELADRLRAEVGKGEAAGRTWAVRVDRLDTGATVFAHRADESRIPASNVKLFTTAAALHRLGPDYTTDTSVYADGPVANGVLDGDLVLYGRGDPNISGRFYESRPTAVLELLAQQVRAAGITHVTGGVVGDGTYFEDLDFGPWNPEDQHRWYAARVNALSFNDNCVDVFVGPGRSVGTRGQLRWEPFTRFVRVTMGTRTVNGRRGNVQYWRNPGTRTIGLAGTIGVRSRIRAFSVAVEQPALYAAWVFRDVLRGAGITVDGDPRERTRTADGPGRYTRELARHASLPLAEELQVINGRSQNLHAELLCKSLGKTAGADGSWAEGLRAVDAALCDLGLQTDGLRLVDASGLARENRATASSLVAVLKAMAAHPHAAVFEDSLVHVGVDPNMTDLAKSIHRGELRGKSGSLKGVLALSGYIRAPGRAPLAFAMLGADPRSTDSRPLKRTRDALAYILVRHAPEIATLGAD